MKNVISKFWVKSLSRAIISITLMAWLISHVEFKEIFLKWHSVNWFILFFWTILLHLLFLILKAIRLKMLLKQFDIKLTTSWLTIIQLKGNFLKNFIPGGITGDIYKTYAIIKKNKLGGKTISTVLIEKAFGTFALILLAIVCYLIGVFAMKISIFIEILRPVLIAFGVSLLCVILFFKFFQSGVLEIWFYGIPFISEMILNMKQLMNALLDLKKWIRIALLSLAIQIALVVWYWAVASITNLHFSLIVLFVAIPVAEFLIALPISIGGLGVRESAFVFLFRPFGMTLEEIISFSLLCFFVMTIIRIISGITFLIYTDHDRLQFN